MSSKIDSWRHSKYFQPRPPFCRKFSRLTNLYILSDVVQNVFIVSLCKYSIFWITPFPQHNSQIASLSKKTFWKGEISSTWGFFGCFEKILNTFKVCYQGPEGTWHCGLSNCCRGKRTRVLFELLQNVSSLLDQKLFVVSALRWK